ncbi:helix-turn-helix domain-containing protein [Fibrisoma limi]|nr:helix-turn-helix domain-containing protein [Fibrisoma limi]
MKDCKEMDEGNSTTVVVKGLTSNGLIYRIRQELLKAGIQVTAMGPGFISIKQPALLSRLDEVLDAWGIDLLDESESQLIRRTKSALQYSLEQQILPLRGLLRNLSEHTGCPYYQLSSLFLAVEGVTLGRYVLRQRLDKAIERLTYTNGSVSEIAHQTGYRDETHLALHVEAERGLPIAHFLKIRTARFSTYPNRSYELFAPSELATGS